MKNQPPKLIKVLLIDPYKKELRKAQLSPDLDTWHQLLRCECLDNRRLTSENGYSLHIWFDDLFLAKDPVPPWFEMTDFSGGTGRYAGYAFLCHSNPKGETISVGPDINSIPNLVFQKLLGLHWEDYELRLGKDACLEQRLRMPELEMPGRFKFLDDIRHECGNVHL